MTLVVQLKTHMIAQGYRFETIETEEGVEERMYRPDGSLALIALKRQVVARPPVVEPDPVPVPASARKAERPRPPYR
jgi:hypothetical protein